VPTILKMMVEHAAIDRYDHSSLSYIIYAGARCTARTRRLRSKLGKVLVQYFGLARVNPAYHGAAA